MAKTRQQKEQTVANLGDKFSRVKGAVLVDYKGLKVKDAQKIRETSWGAGIDYAVVKKTLLKLALNKVSGGSQVDTKQLQGNIGLVLGYNDEVETAKFAARFAKELETFKLLGGLFEGKFVDGNQVKALASLPSRVELLGKLVGTLNAPISGLVNVLAGNLRGLVQVLNAIQEQRAR